MNLFYSKEDKTLFWVAGYIGADNTLNVDEMIASLREKWNEFMRITELPSKKTAEIKTDFITRSSRYKYMRVFWCENVEEEDVPEYAYKLDNKWTMWTWLKN